MKRILVYIAAGLLVFGGSFSCTKKIYVPVETTKYVAVHDTTYLHRTDTLVKVPDVSISDYINIADTLRLEAPYATSTAWVDTTLGMLKGRLVQGGKMPVQIVEKERLVVKDSVVVKEVPVEVYEKVPYVPLFWRVCSVIGILAVAALCFWLFFKIK